MRRKEKAADAAAVSDATSHGTNRGGSCCFGDFPLVSAATLHVSPAGARDVTFPHMELRLLGIVVGGASVAGGIGLFAAG